MNSQWLSRTALLLEPEQMLAIANAHVLVVGLGGVGSFAAEFLVRAGIGRLTIVDGDVVEASNRNRQLPALVSSDGQPKAQWMSTRLLDINPDLQLHSIEGFMTAPFLEEVLSTPFDYVVDAIDTMSPKTDLVKLTMEKGYPLVSSMGAGGKLDPTKVTIADISQTYNCFFAQQLRKNLKRINLRTGFKTVFSSELPDKSKVKEVLGVQYKKSILGTISYIPALFGTFCASVVIRDIAAITYELKDNPLTTAHSKTKKKKKKRN